MICLLSMTGYHSLQPLCFGPASAFRSDGCVYYTPAVRMIGGNRCGVKRVTIENGPTPDGAPCYCFSHLIDLAFGPVR